MDWTWINELLQNIEVYELITTLIGLTGFTFGISLWDAFKKGKKSFEMHEEYKKEGWTTEEKDEYIEQSGKFWASISNLWDVVKGLFKK